jgi:hypothetical protein
VFPTSFWDSDLVKSRFFFFFFLFFFFSLPLSLLFQRMLVVGMFCSAQSEYVRTKHWPEVVVCLF